MTSKLEIFVISASKLSGVDFNGLSDPYVKVKIFRTNADGKEQRFKTERVKNSLSPVWNAELV